MKIRSIETKKDKFIVIHGQDCADILKDNYLQRLHTDEIWSRGKRMKKVAGIPTVVWLEWERLGITQDHKSLLKMIELHPEYKTTQKTLI